jgi:hypothetical protein
MKKNRVIPILLLKNGWLVQSRGFSQYNNIGNPVTSVKRLSQSMEPSPKPSKLVLRMRRWIRRNDRAPRYWQCAKGDFPRYYLRGKFGLYISSE